MINFLDKLYSSIKYKNKFLSKIKFYSTLRFSVKLFANTFIPLYYVLSQKNEHFKLSNVSANKNIYIVSLTTFPNRIKNIWLVIESLLHQKQKPDKIILWLSNQQFESIDILPKRLLNLQKRGLEIRFCDDDLRSHKKYYYAFLEFPDSYIITVDDDVFYNTNLIKSLILTSKKYPNTICCNEASYILKNKKSIEPYSNWQPVYGEQEPNNLMLPIGVGGILYPPNSIYKDVFNIELLKRTCFLADDIWLNAMSRIKGTKVSKTSYNSSYIPIIYFKNKTLNSINVSEGFNDKQIKDIQSYYLENLNIDLFDIE